MKKYAQVLFVLTVMFTASVTTAASLATATLTNILQSGTIANSAKSSANIISVIYSLGAAGNGIATWKTAGSGTASDFLTNPLYFQTVTWSGLNIAAGSDFVFSGLNIDRITSLSPLKVDARRLDRRGGSLSNATLSLLWSDGSMSSTGLFQRSWNDTQNLSLSSSTSAVPIPAALFMFAPALMGFLGLRRKAKS